jgi:hypothetical protein
MSTSASRSMNKFEGASSAGDYNQKFSAAVSIQ